MFMAWKHVHVYTHALVCSTLSTCGDMSGVFSTALHLRSFPLKRKLCADLQAQLAWGDTVAEVSGEGRVRRTEQWDPAVSSCRCSQPKASHTLGESILFPAQGCLEDISSVWLTAGTTLAFFSSRKSLSNKNLAMPESEFHFREEEEFRKWQEPGTRSVDSNTPDFVWVSIPLLRW